MLAMIMVLAFSLSACGGGSGDAGSGEAATDEVYEWDLSCEYSADNHQTIALEDAAKQILDKRYAEPYLAEKYKNVFAIGIGFGGKDCYIQTLGNLAKASI